MNIMIAGLLVALALANLIVSIWVRRTDWLLRNQKVAQILLIWFVPTLGALGIAIFLRSNRELSLARSNHIPDENDWVAGSGRSSADD